MGYAFTRQELANVAHRARQYAIAQNEQTGDRLEFEGLDVDLLLESIVDALLFEPTSEREG